VRLFIRLSFENIDEAKRVISDNFGKVEFVVNNKHNLISELAFTTQMVKEQELSEKLEELKASNAIKEVVSVIRIEE